MFSLLTPSRKHPSRLIFKVLGKNISSSSTFRSNILSVDPQLPASHRSVHTVNVQMICKSFHYYNPNPDTKWVCAWSYHLPCYTLLASIFAFCHVLFFPGFTLAPTTGCCLPCSQEHKPWLLLTRKASPNNFLRPTCSWLGTSSLQ